MSGTGRAPVSSGFPAWATIPSDQDLATGRVVHFFFAWLLVGTLLVWLARQPHQRPHPARSRPAPRRPAPPAARYRSIIARLKFHHTREYNTLQKLAYVGVLFVLFPLMILTGLAMSPAMNAACPLLADMFGGRQTARTIHFIVMLLLVGFFIIHMLMILAAGPINELRSIITGWYRIDPPEIQRHRAECLSMPKFTISRRKFLTGLSARRSGLLAFGLRCLR